MFASKLLSSETWSDFETLFARHGGLHGGCWCVYHRMTMSQYIATTKEQRYALQRDLVAAGRSTGLLLYEEGLAVGWCQFGAASVFPAFDRMRDYVKLALPESLRPRWRITCLVVDKAWRNRGLARILLRETLSAIDRLGGGIVEAFPLEVPGMTRPQYTGSVKMYRECGFCYVSPIGKYNHLVRLDPNAAAE